MLRILTIIIVVVLLAAAGYYGYQTFTSSGADIVESVAPRDGLPGAEIVAQLNKLPSDLKGTVFSSPAYTKLVDGSIELSQMPVGKNNPFAITASIRTTPLPKKR